MKKLPIILLICLCAALIFGGILGIIIFTSPQDEILGTWEMDFDESKITLPEIAELGDADNKIHTIAKSTMRFYSDNTGYIETHSRTMLEFYSIELSLIEYKVFGDSRWEKTDGNTYSVWLTDDISFETSVTDGSILGFIITPALALIPDEFSSIITDFIRPMILPYENPNGALLTYYTDKDGNKFLQSQSRLIYTKTEEISVLEKLFGNTGRKIQSYLP